VVLRGCATFAGEASEIGFVGAAAPWRGSEFADFPKLWFRALLAEDSAEWVESRKKRDKR
jgi:hypothetical protein